ncbi:DNA alkylation repair protein [Agromyces albus]|uniref:DNA alkylation repair protein n=2 Tax=Agromyces albus TaxID=205332 RepID=A0A4Q2KRD0_9MICO|nr:DNA alkylation repair protein [Agromyces albus]
MANDEERAKYARYFAPDPDAPFLGVRMGAVFELAKTALDLPASELEALLERPAHEVRALACSIMGKAAARAKTPESRRAELYDLYLRRHDRIDQWDLVDLAARDVVGRHLVDRDRSPLYRLAASAFWPERRTALVATFAFLKRGELDDAYALAELLAEDPEPFVQKALGWVLRAAGDLDAARLTAYVERHAPTMPRVALRAAIEHFAKDERARILAIR